MYGFWCVHVRVRFLCGLYNVLFVYVRQGVLFGGFHMKFCVCTHEQELLVMLHSFVVYLRPNDFCGFTLYCFVYLRPSEFCLASITIFLFVRTPKGVSLWALPRFISNIKKENKLHASENPSLRIDVLNGKYKRLYK